MRFVLRARDARFERGGIFFCPALSLDVQSGGTHAIDVATDSSATTAALLFAGLVKATHGFVTIGDYDPAMQAVQAKRLAAFVSAEHNGCTRTDFERALRLRAGLWSIELPLARRRAGTIVDAFGIDDAFGRALALACVRETPLIVLDRPPHEESVRLVRAILPAPAIVAVRSELPLPVGAGTRA